MSARNYVPAMVKWMVEEGTKNTSSGNWIFTSAEIAEAFPVAESSVIEMFGAILTEVYQHEAVAGSKCKFRERRFGNFRFDLLHRLLPEHQ